MTDVLVYAVESRAQTARALLGAACQVTGLSARLELYTSGSLYQRLGPRHASPLPDVVMWFGAFAAQAAALDGLLQPYQPAQVAPGVVHESSWRWTGLDYSAIGIVGSPSVSSFADLAGVPTLALADPERSEVGLTILLATLDRARQVESNVESGWTWWQTRAVDGLSLAEDDPGAVALVGSGASHALTLTEPSATPLAGLAPLPHAVSLAASSRNVDAARRLLDWLASPAAGNLLPQSPWQAGTNGLQAALSAAPPLDVDWGRQQYSASRQRWAQSAFSPSVTS